jgi:putative tricarboxylic transport membrane protein
MRGPLPWGDLLLAVAFAALGLVWILGAPVLGLWEGFAPGSGFLPLVYGIALIVLAVAAGIEAVALRAPQSTEPLGKPLLIAIALTVAVIGIGIAGFGPSMFVLLLFLYAVVERLPPLRSTLAAAGCTGGLLLLFGRWLDVPLPAGPLGF